MSSSFLQSKKASGLKPILESYVPNRAKSVMRNSSSIANFIGKQKNNSFHIPSSNNTIKGIDLSFCQFLTQTPTKEIGRSMKKLRGSKSVGKNCGIIQNDSEKLLNLSSNNFILESIYGPDRHLLTNNNTTMTLKNTKDSLINSSSKKIKLDNPSHISCNTTLNRISEDLKRIKKSGIVQISQYNTAIPRYSAVQSKSSKRNNLNSTTLKNAPQRSIKNVKLEKNGQKKRASKSRDMTFSQAKTTECEPNYEIDSAANITDTTTGKRFDDHRSTDRARILVNALSNTLNTLERTKGKCSTEDIITKKYNAINETISGMISLDSGLSDILRIIYTKLIETQTEADMKFKQQNDFYRSEIVKLNNEIKSLKNENEKIHIEKSKLDKELSDKNTIYEKQKNMISDLKKELSDLRKENLQKNNDLAEDVATLYEENKKLAAVARKLYMELQKSKKNEQKLSQMLQQNSQQVSYSESSEYVSQPQGTLEADQPKKPAKILEVGKNKVKIPELDFSRLAKKKPAKLKVVKYYKNAVPGESHENSESQVENDSEILDENNGEIIGIQDSSNENSEEFVDSQLDNFLGKIGAQSASVHDTLKTN